MTRTSKAEALFASALQPSMSLTKAEIVAAIRNSLRLHGGVRGCAAVMAAEFGERPETAADRMRWALSLATEGV